MSFLKLVNDHDETAIKDQTHELIVYEIGDKVDITENPYYLNEEFKSHKNEQHAKGNMWVQG